MNACVPTHYRRPQQLLEGVQIFGILETHRACRGVGRVLHQFRDVNSQRSWRKVEGSHFVYCCRSCFLCIGRKCRVLRGLSDWSHSSSIIDRTAERQARCSNSGSQRSRLRPGRLRDHAKLQKVRTCQVPKPFTGLFRKSMASLFWTSYEFSVIEAGTTNSVLIL